MAKSPTHYACQSCGAGFPKWAGRCEACGSWNTLVEEIIAGGPPKGLGGTIKNRKSGSIEFVAMKGAEPALPRRMSGIGEFDRVVGGGLVARLGFARRRRSRHRQIDASAASRLACSRKQYKTTYISGEEAVDQVRMRAARLGLSEANCDLAAATSIRDIVGAIDNADAPDILIIDSIQTMYVDTLDSAPGTVAQVRTSAQELIRVAKKRDISHHPRRPCDQGRHDRRPARAGTYGRYRSLSRRRPRASVPRAARREKPFRPDG